MKITADMFTEDMGFIEGSIIKFDNRIMSWDNCNIDLIINLNEKPFKEIKVLTGPMSIWNHAPDWAKSLIVSNYFDYSWSVDECHILPCVCGTYSIKRPWWAEVKNDNKS